jgi:alanyl-tRNA synthetase
VDLGPSFGCEDACGVGCPRCNRYLEVWNLVFQQYTEAPDGALTPLPAPGIDTGMGLERLALVMQSKRYTTETDELFAILTAALSSLNTQRRSAYAYGDDPALDMGLRIIADHLRAAAFLIADGVAPSNEGPGYVLRRFIRRAYRYGRNLGAQKPFLHEALPAVARVMGGYYPELQAREPYAGALLLREEERFAATLEQGIAIFEEIAEHLSVRRETVIPGEQAFRLYDTYGFPLDVTRELAAERGLQVDEDGFEAAMGQQRVRSRGEAVGLQLHGRRLELPASEFVGYEAESGEGRVVALVQGEKSVAEAAEGQEVAVVLDRTPFYAEKGGQVADHGLIVGPAGALLVEDVTVEGEAYLHRGRVSQGVLRVGDTVTATVDHERRAAIRRHHTATHLLQAALRRALGEHITQAGSGVGAERARFDFHHHEQVSEEILREVERQVNAWVLDNLPVTCAVQALEEAKREGVMALFGEAYGEEVRVIRAGEVSAELCGGTHVGRTGDIGAFRILAESSVAAGIRRIEAVTGMAALEEWRGETGLLRTLGQELKCAREELPERVEGLRRQVRDLEKRVQEARRAQATINVDEMCAAAETINEVRLIAQTLPDMDKETLRELADRLAARAEDAVILLAGTQEDSATFVCKVPDALIARGIKAGDIIREAATAAGGGGGGKPQFAQGGGKADLVELGVQAARRYLAG